jgi:hypothetical protein
MRTLIAKEVMHKLEIVRDNKILSQQEEDLHKFAKLKSLALSSLQRTVARQESRLMWLQEGNTLTCLFLIHASPRCCRKCIRSLVPGDAVLLSKESKAQVTYDYFDQIMGTPTLRSNTINLHELGIQRFDLMHME